MLDSLFVTTIVAMLIGCERNCEKKGMLTSGFLSSSYNWRAKEGILIAPLERFPGAVPGSLSWSY